MAQEISIPRSLAEYILLGPEDDRRQLQESPILGDVWLEFARTPTARKDLLLTPYKSHPAGEIARLVATAVHAEARVAYLQGIIAADLTFEEMIRHLLPLTPWWQDKRKLEYFKKLSNGAYAQKKIGLALRLEGTDRRERSPLDRYVALTGLILWAADGDAALEKVVSRIKTSSADPTQTLAAAVRDLDQKILAKKVQSLFKTISFEMLDEPRIWIVSLNRQATAALEKSVPAVKADAARTLFNVRCNEIAWAVLDSGIASDHVAFRQADSKESRVKQSFDFSRIRDIVSISADKALDARLIEDAIRNEPKRSGRTAAGLRSTKEQLKEHLQTLRDDAERGRSIDWRLVEPFLRLAPGNEPLSEHGTHVAGIIGGRKCEPPEIPDGEIAGGMCPDIWLYDFRVLGQDLKETEFAIIAALQYIRYLNERGGFMMIHGANLSLSIKHDVRNYACGRTPVCDECERLIGSGVVVVAAAGNHGWKSLETQQGVYETYSAFSVTDPGNADGVITVGSTHRFWPHTYGVSFFSSRGPTGDGRLKPDLVAPGEKIVAPVPGNTTAPLDGTSMAAPHVSGAAAMLMARHSELIGQPRRIKQILCDTATDLGRERSFQGHGMLDVLRALQSV